MLKDPVKIAQKQERSFLLEKRSSLERSGSPKSYYVIRKHSMGVPSMQNVFIEDQNSQVNPIILPGSPISLKYRGSFTILAENGFSIITEVGQSMITE